ncbi:Os12g0424300 [Oryza sativa Japonica Group]|uniref:Os12g0424300 protein n=1 Tax=Oryza sativa subsp. japonica TaxID=39947 RepID=A0A0P0Y9L0_ORYSJ|nr:Os12g0424300 [Oryza sativa Japonica Group]
MSYISGARSLADEQVRIASTKMDGIGPKKAIQLRYRLGISGNIKMNELTKYQIDQIEQMIAQDHVVQSYGRVHHQTADEEQEALPRHKNAKANRNIWTSKTRVESLEVHRKKRIFDSSAERVRPAPQWWQGKNGQVKAESLSLLSGTSN